MSQVFGDTQRKRGNETCRWRTSSDDAARRDLQPARRAESAYSTYCQFDRPVAQNFTKNERNESS